ncbi:MAG TPA: hypothetical protein VGM25_14555 [Caulobacteraceae bacterium]|jgi:hypothetical protein
MQFIEESVIGVRSARLTFSSPTTLARVILFPMVHVGEPNFYRDTFADVHGHDVVLLEGVHSPIVNRITASYRWIEGSKGLSGLVVQPRFPDESRAIRVVHADFSQDEFEVEWRKLPMWERFAVSVAAPLLGLHRRWCYSRQRLAKNMSCEDQPSLSELLTLAPETGGLTQAILHARDERLIQCLRAELDVPSARRKSIAVLYGAAHMRAVVHELTRLRDFNVSEAEWRTIMSLI